MIKNLFISIFNSFFYLLFVILALILAYNPTYESKPNYNSEFYQFLVAMIFFTLPPIYTFIKYIRKRIIVKASFPFSYFYLRIIPLFLIVGLISIDNFFPELFGNLDDYTNNFVHAVGIFILFVWFILKYFIHIMKIPMMLVLYIAHPKNPLDFFSPFQFELLNELIEHVIVEDYYIIDNCKDSDFVSIYSNNKIIKYNHIKDLFLIDNINASYETIFAIQDEFNKNLFEMNEDELSIIKMMSI